jgi:hypothetical protein
VPEETCKETYCRSLLHPVKRPSVSLFIFLPLTNVVLVSVKRDLLYRKKDLLYREKRPAIILWQMRWEVSGLVHL